MSTTSRRHGFAASMLTAVGAGAVALSAMALNAPAASAASLFHQDCVERPQIFHPRAHWGELFYAGPTEACRVYDVNDVLLATVYDPATWQPKPRPERVPVLPRI